MAKPRIFLLIPSYQPNDAVGNDVLGMYQFLREADYETRIFAGQMHPSYQSMATILDPAATEYWDDPKAILIYHHAIEWKPGEEVLRRSRNRTVIKYHNVTPAEFFAPYAEHYYHACVHGAEATKRLAKYRIDFVWGASRFNAEEFRRLGVSAERCRVIPPLHRIEDLAQSPLDAVVTGQYRDGRQNILFVGAFRPNKGHFKALEVFAAYRRRAGTNSARLLFAGSYDPSLHLYIKELEDYARLLEVNDGLAFCMSVSLTQLRSLYTASDAFLCVSEHEGFCVPLVEAMYFRTPIIAWASTAIAETCDGCGIIHENFRADEMAESLESCLEGLELSRTLASRGRLRYETAFHPDVIRAKLLGLVEEAQTV